MMMKVREVGDFMDHVIIFFTVDGDRFVVELDRGEDEDLGLVVAKRPSAMASTGLFFVKSLIPESPAIKCDNLMQNDIILQVLY